MQNKMVFLLFTLLVVICSNIALRVSKPEKPVFKIEHNISYENVINISKENVLKQVDINSLSNEDKDILLVHEVLVQLELIGIDEKNHTDKKLAVIRKLQNEVTTNEAKTALLYYSMKHNKEPMEIDYE